MRVRARWIVLGVVAVAISAVFVGCPETHTTRPELTVTVTAGGKPVARAKVVLVLWSQPHSRLDERTEFRTDASGRFVSHLAEETERVYPFCMHGVPYYELLVCIDHPGYRDVVVPFDSDAKARAITVSLTPGEGYHTCDDDPERGVSAIQIGHESDRIARRDDIWPDAVEVIAPPHPRPVP